MRREQGCGTNLNAGAAQATFPIPNYAVTPLLTGPLGTNSPVAAGRETGDGFIATHSGTTAIDLMHPEYVVLAWEGDRLR